MDVITAAYDGDIQTMGSISIRAASRLRLRKGTEIIISVAPRAN